MKGNEMLYIISTWKNGNRRMFVSNGLDYAYALARINSEAKHARMKEYGHVICAWELMDTFETLEQFESQFADWVEVQSVGVRGIAQARAESAPAGAEDLLTELEGEAS